MSNVPPTEEERKKLSSSQLLALAKEHGVILTPAEQKKLSSSQLLLLAQLGQSLTEDSRKKFSSTQLLEFHRLAAKQQLARFDAAGVQRFLESKWGSEPECPMCRHKSWSISDRLVEMREYQGGVLSAGAVFTLLPVSCDNCGNTILINEKSIDAASRAGEERSP